MRSLAEFQNKYFSTEEAAQYLRTNPVILRSARCSGELWGRPGPKYLKVGSRKVLYERASLEAWIHAVPEQIVVGGAYNG